MKILYFAHFRERTGVAEESVRLPDHLHDVASLIDWLVSRDERYARAFADRNHVRVAVNQEHVKFDALISDSDEIAFFPPMTGG